jgi:putative FmdB family regulatory protein
LPTYQYRCTDCGHELEEFQSFTDDALTVCPVCGGRLRKMFNAVGVVFKGSGFYRNDSRQTSPASAGDSGSSPASTTADSSSTSSDPSSSKGSSDSGTPSKRSKEATSSSPATPSTGASGSSAGS